MARMVDLRGLYRVKPVGKRPLGKPRPKSVYNIKMDFLEVRCG